MSPLQRIAMGLVIIVGSARFPADPSPAWKSYDALADPVGWVLVLLGVFALARTDEAFETSRWLAVLAAVVSVPMWLPQLQHRLDESGEWFVSLPQIAFCLVLSREIGMQAVRRSPPDPYVAKRFGLLVWGFALAAVLPVIALGGDVPALESPTFVLSVVVNLALVYSLFRVHRREWLGGPGPLEIAPGGGPKDSQGGSTGTREGRPPSR